MRHSDYLQPGDLCEVIRVNDLDTPLAQVYGDNSTWAPETTIGMLEERESVIFLELWVGAHAAAWVMTRFGLGWMRWDRLVRLNVR